MRPTHDPPLVSVVVPVFNGERYLGESLGSILAQSYEALEVIVMDDASSDGSARIAAEFAAADRRVTVPRRASNVGQFANVNDGIALARGEFVAVYHADDVYGPDIVTRGVAFLESQPEVGAVFALDIFVDADRAEIGRAGLPPPEIARKELLSYHDVLNSVLRYTNTFLRTPTALVRREVYDEVGVYSTDYGLRGDLEMWLRIARRHPLGLIDEYCMSYRVGHDNESKRHADLRTDADPSFDVLDDRLMAGDRRLADREALSAYEGHRAADLLLAAVNAYVLDRPDAVRQALRRVRPFGLLATRRVQRWRLLVLWGTLQALVRMPRIPIVARLFYRRWHRKKLGGRRRLMRSPLRLAGGRS